MKRQFAAYEAGRPRSTGSLATALRDLKGRLGFRRSVVRNQARLDLLFALMALDLRKEAGERTFARVLRRLVEANAGGPGSRTALDGRQGRVLAPRVSRRGRAAPHAEAGAEPGARGGSSRETSDPEGSRRPRSDADAVPARRLISPGYPPQPTSEFDGSGIGVAATPGLVESLIVPAFGPSSTTSVKVPGVG